MAVTRALTSGCLCSTFRTTPLLSRPTGPILQKWLQSSMHISIDVPVVLKLGIPALLAGLWESILRAVPKKKTSHRKKRQRFMAGKGLRDITALNRCSACGNVKRAHLLCPFCVGVRIHSTTDPTFPLVQTLEQAHPLGCHHLTSSKNGQVAASVGFGGEVKVWKNSNGVWSERRKIVGAGFPCTLEATVTLEQGANWLTDGNKAGEIWAIALSENGQYLAATSFDGRINVWDDLADGAKIREFETKGSFGMSIDLVISSVVQF
ncbi:MAG: hypothetical protein Q9163_002282 [Psora crenata]